MNYRDAMTVLSDLIGEAQERRRTIRPTRELRWREDELLDDAERMLAFTSELFRRLHNQQERNGSPLHRPLTGGLFVITYRHNRTCEVRGVFERDSSASLALRYLTMHEDGLPGSFDVEHWPAHHAFDDWKQAYNAERVEDSPWALD